MQNEEDLADQQNRNEQTGNYNTGYYRPEYPPYGQQGNIYAPNSHQAPPPYPYVTVGSSTGQQAAPMYYQTVPQVPSQVNLSPNPLIYPNMNPNNTIPYSPSTYPTVESQQTQRSSFEGEIGIHRCPDCGDTFERLGRFEAHVNAHRDIRPYPCGGSCGISSCDASFTSAEALGSHKKKDRVQCENCGHLVAKKNMARHHKSHCQSLLY